MKIKDIVTEVNCKYGAPMGRRDIGGLPAPLMEPSCRIFKKYQPKVYVKRVHLWQGYDIGGAYWGMPSNLYVKFTKDLAYVEYFRK